MADDSRLRTAIIGCGAVSQRCHIPAVKAHPQSKVEWLVDPDDDLLRRLSKDVGQVKTAKDYREIVGVVDAAVLAVPHSMHAPIAVDLMKRGIHILVEKPMATSGAECEAMIEAADEGQVVLAVGLMRRFLQSARFARWVVRSGLLGHVESFDFREGNVYSWPVQSDFFFRKETARGGVLVDTGAHTLDLLLWWLGEVDQVEYYDDSYGGVEADCELHLSMASGARGVVELSRTRNLRNTAIIRGEKAELEVGLRTNEAVVRSRDGSSGLAGRGLGTPHGTPVTQGFTDLFPLQIDDWIEAIRAGRPPTVPGVEGRRSVALIEACYATRKPLELPWMSPDNGGPAN